VDDRRDKGRWTRFETGRQAALRQHRHRSTRSSTADLWCEVPTDWNGLLLSPPGVKIELLAVESGTQPSHVEHSGGTLAPAYRHWRRRHPREGRPYYLGDAYDVDTGIGVPRSAGAARGVTHRLLSSHTDCCRCAGTEVMCDREAGRERRLAPRARRVVGAHRSSPSPRRSSVASGSHRAGTGGRRRSGRRADGTFARHRGSVQPCLGQGCRLIDRARPCLVAALPAHRTRATVTTTVVDMFCEQLPDSCRFALEEVSQQRASHLTHRWSPAAARLPRNARVAICR
jgi:hypothetical protein